MVKRKKEQDILEEVLNSSIEELSKTLDKNTKTKKQMLFDTPIKSRKENLDEREKEMEEKYVVKNAFSATELKDEETDFSVIETILSVIFGLIKDVNEDGQKYMDYNILEDFYDELKNTNTSDIAYIQDEVADYLTTKDFDVETYFEDDNGELFMNLHIEW